MMDTLLSSRRRQLLQGLSAAALVAGCGDPLSGKGSPAAAYRFGGPTMGTTYSVKIAGAHLSPTAQDAARLAVESALADVDARMSTYRETSELTRFNRHRGDTPFALSPSTFAVFRQAQQVSAMADGAFDITVAPLVDAWGFGPAGAHGVVGDERLPRLTSRVGWRMLVLDAATATVAKQRPDVTADLSGIAKGYAVERAARALEALGFGDYMVEAGGEVRTRGRNASSVPWQIAIERPDAVPQRAHMIVPLSGQAMATSGDYRIYFEQGGQRYCHEIDPATGRPIRHGLASVTVVAADCGEADALATALIVLGPERGHALAVQRDLAALFIVREVDGGFIDRPTPAFAALGGRAAAG
jgi:thiamine biosynthesis lipoprotein